MRKFIFTVLFCSCITVFAQSDGLNRNDVNILVYIMPDSLELSPAFKLGAKVQDATIKSRQLGAVLSKIKINKIVKTLPDWNEDDSITYTKDGRFVKKPEFHRIFTLSLSSEVEANKAIEILSHTPGVLYAEKDVVYKLFNDMRYLDGTQWHLKNYGQYGGLSGADVNAEAAWSIYTGNPDIKIAILDSGVETWHEDLTGKASGDGHQGNRHGTAVAGVAAAKANNFYGGRGLDWNVRIVSYLTHGIDGADLGESVIASAINSAVNNATDIINCSWGGTGYSSTSALAFAYAYKMDKVVVAAMGNDDIGQVFYPAALPNVIAVGSTDNRDVHRPSSMTGSHIDVVAPGENIFTTTINDEYDRVNGTSFSTPLVSGLASLLKGYKSDLENDDIRQIIRLSAKKVPGMLGLEFSDEYGYGRIDAGRALSFLNTPFELVKSIATSGVAVSTSNQFVTQFISASGLNTGNYLVKRIEVQKTVSLPNNLYNFIGVWGRGVSSTGWSVVSPNFGEGFCEVVPGSLTSTSVTLRTYVYEVWSLSGQYIGYRPTTPTNATFAYSVLGHTKPTISGPSAICSESSGTYTIDYLPENANVTWSKSNRLEWVSTTNNSVTVGCNGVAFAPYIDWVSASIVTGSDIIVLEKSINACRSGIAISGSSVVEYLDSETYSVNIESGGCPIQLNYEWWLDGVKVSDAHVITISSISSGLNSLQMSSSYALLPPGGGIPTVHTLELFAKNNNGDLLASDTKTITIYGNYIILSPDVNIVGIESFTIYPNPANEILTVSVNTSEKAEQNVSVSNDLVRNSSTIFSVMIINERQGLVRTAESKGLDCQVSLRGLPVGLYFVHILRDGRIVNKQIVEKR